MSRDCLPIYWPTKTSNTLPEEDTGKSRHSSQHCSTHLLQDSGSTSDLRAEKFERNASRYWDRFYKEHQDGFFRDRHYLHREFPALEEGAPTILEVPNH